MENNDIILTEQYLDSIRIVYQSLAGLSSLLPSSDICIDLRAQLLALHDLLEPILYAKPTPHPIKILSHVRNSEQLIEQCKKLLSSEKTTKWIIKRLQQ